MFYWIPCLDMKEGCEELHGTVLLSESTDLARLGMCDFWNGGIHIHTYINIVTPKKRTNTLWQFSHNSFLFYFNQEPNTITYYQEQEEVTGK